MIVEVLLDPNRDLAGDDPIIITQLNLWFMSSQVCESHHKPLHH